MFSPLSQFDIVTVVPFFFFSVLDLSLNNLVLTVFWLLVLLFILLLALRANYRIIPSVWQAAIESMFLFIYRMVIAQIGYKGLVYFPFIFSIFTFILFLNLWGLTPISFATTSHLIWTVYFSTSICLGIFFTGILNHKIRFFKIFLPDVPLLLVPLMILIEIASYIIRSFSLAVRLSANIMAGHTLAHILGEAVSSLFVFGFDLSFIAFALLLAIMVLEFGVACLQAYVFTLLVCMYLNDAINLTSH